MMNLEQLQAMTNEQLNEAMTVEEVIFSNMLASGLSSEDILKRVRSAI